jgi:hypothetical protein
MERAAEDGAGFAFADAQVGGGRSVAGNPVATLDGVATLIDAGAHFIEQDLSLDPDDPRTGFPPGVPDSDRSSSSPATRVGGARTSKRSIVGAVAACAVAGRPPVVWPCR